MQPRSQRGFSLIEVMIALVVLGIGMAGIIGLQRVAASSSGYSRRATEAAVLAEAKLEQLRTVNLDETDSEDEVDAQGKPADEGPFTRTWSYETVDTLTTITVTVSWSEADGNHSVVMRTTRVLPP